MTLQRFPDGVDGEEFFSKNPPRGVPAWARSVTVHLPLRSQPPPAGRRRGRHGRVGRADEHRHLPPVAGAHRATPTTRTSCGSTSTRSRAPTSPTRCAAAHALRELLGRDRPDRRGPRPPATAACTSTPGSARPTSSSTSATPSSASPASSSAGCRSRSPPPGGRRSAASGSSSTSTRPTATAPSPRPTARGRCPARRCRCRSAGTSSTRSHRATSPCAPCPTCWRADGDAWAGMDDAVGDVAHGAGPVGRRRPRARAGRDALPAGLPEDAGRAAAGPAQPRQAPDQRKHPVARVQRSSAQRSLP